MIMLECGQSGQLRFFHPLQCWLAISHYKQTFKPDELITLFPFLIVLFFQGIFCSLQIMTTHNPVLPVLLVVTILLSTLHSSTCRQLGETSYRKTQVAQQGLIRLRARFLMLFPEHLSATSLSAVSQNEKFSSVHGVSHQLVPGGPNPLHN